MSRVWNENSLARIATTFEIGSNEHDTGQLAAGTRGWLKRDRIHAGDFSQTIGGGLQDFKIPLYHGFRHQRMTAGNPIKASNPLVNPRVVFHGAGTQRVHSGVNAVIPGREPGEVTDDIGLAKLRKIGDGFTDVSDAKGVFQVTFRHVQGWQIVGRPSRRATFKDQILVLRDMRSSFTNGHGLMSDFLCSLLLSSSATYRCSQIIVTPFALSSIKAGPSPRLRTLSPTGEDL